MSASSSPVSEKTLNSNSEFGPEYEKVSLSIKPTTTKWALPMMFHISAKGVAYGWQLAFNGTHLQRIYGTTNAPQYADKVVETNSSGRTINQQAYLHATRAFILKYREGYQLPGATEPPMVTGMKGHPYKEGMIKKWPAMASLKLDGVRGLFQQVGPGKGVLKSYKNCEFGHMTAIIEQLNEFMPYLPPYAVLDGELYCHGMPFHEVTSAVKTNKTLHPELHRIKFHIFDIYYEANPPTETRYLLLKKAYDAFKAAGGNVDNFLVLTKWYVRSHADILKHVRLVIDKGGYEGLVLNRCGNGSKPGSLEYRMSQYSFGRSNRIMKLKDRIDEEGTVIGVIPAKGKEKELGLLVIKDKFGFEINIRLGEIAERTAWLKNPSLVIGKELTFQHIGRHPDSNKAIQPTGVAFRDYE